MGVQKKTRKFAQTKRAISLRDNRLKDNAKDDKNGKATKAGKEECIPIVTDCVIAELEKLGQKYRLALRVAKDPRFERIKCDHKGTYADDCLVDRVIKHRVYIVATNDRDLKRRIRKIPGAPIMSVARGKYVIERLPDAPEK
ncbi:rRNA-processing protein FCF1 [Penicillium macrosclerotiorum]|uniref:rRNA-processing protein FCF1 n=1 Tax=Penicillium macrosclerotiorum TaxID=303699 RepID=UPI002546A185|nr:rRNA-processing protein FCF1 [Penicillium macrosclerotiorum]KAJ5692056.1 rRNA-processing protein FCF1 [Penicillium macrosclerotiorum]